MAKRSNSQKGFTIVEIIVVIVVIAVLVTITLVSFAWVQNQAKASTAATSVATVNHKMEEYNGQYGYYPTALNEVGIADSDKVTYQYTGNTTIGYCVTATVGNISYYASATAKEPSAGACAGHALNGQPLAVNYVTNPSFETGSTGWGWINGNGYNGAVSTTQKFSGNSSFAITTPAIGGTTYDRYFEYYVNVTTPGTYYLQSHVYITSNGATFSNRDVWMHCGSGACTGGSTALSYNRSNLNTWQTFTTTVNVTGTASIRLRFYAPLGGTTYVDGIMASNQQSQYADGDSSGWIWTGTANASTSTGAAK